MRVLFRWCTALFTAALAAVPATMSAQYMRLTEFVDTRGAQLDSAIATWQKHHAKVPGSYNYSYFTGDNGRRYVTEQLTSFADVIRNDSITAAIGSTLPNRGAFEKTFYASFGSSNTSIWKQVPELITNPSNLTSAQLAQLTFRRATIRHVHPGMEAQYLKALKEIIAGDTKLKAVYATVVYEQVTGAGAPAFLLVTYMPSSDAYWAAIADRAAKRAGCNGCLGDAVPRLNASVRETEGISLTKIQALSVLR